MKDELCIILFEHVPLNSHPFTYGIILIVGQFVVPFCCFVETFDTNTSTNSSGWKRNEFVLKSIPSKSVSVTATVFLLYMKVFPLHYGGVFFLCNREPKPHSVS